MKQARRAGAQHAAHRRAAPVRTAQQQHRRDARPRRGWRITSPDLLGNDDPLREPLPTSFHVKRSSRRHARAIVRLSLQPTRWPSDTRH